MDVKFVWNVMDNRILSRGFELMDEFNEGEQHVIVKWCFKTQWELESRANIQSSYECIIPYERTWS